VNEYTFECEIVGAAPVAAPKAAEPASPAKAAAKPAHAKEAGK
jgi:hypothetical protein